MYLLAEKLKLKPYLDVIYPSCWQKYKIGQDNLLTKLEENKNSQNMAVMSTKSNGTYERHLKIFIKIQMYVLFDISISVNLSW